MPALSVWMIRAALAYLVVGSSVGAWLLGAKGTPLLIMPAGLVAAHAEALMVGWAAQLTLGVAFWIAPRFREGPPRGDERTARAGAALLNAGLLLAALGMVLSGNRWSAWAVLAGRVLAAGAVILFAAHLWPRVKGVS